MQPVEYNQRAEESAHYAGHDSDAAMKTYSPKVNGQADDKFRAKYAAWRKAQNETLSLCDESELEDVDLSFLLEAVCNS